MGARISGVRPYGILNILNFQNLINICLSIMVQ